jgi:quinol monooxygenase YgiN
MTKFVLLLLCIIALTTAGASAQIRRSTGLLVHNHGPVMFYAQTVTLAVKPEQREQFLQATSALQAKGAHETGCLSYHYYEDPATRNNFLLLSEWNSAATFKSHQQQPYVVTYFGQLSSWLSEPATVSLLETVNHQTTQIQVKP